MEYWDLKWTLKCYLSIQLVGNVIKYYIIIIINYLYYTPSLLFLAKKVAIERVSDGFFLLLMILVRY